jgi:hypothetical protein
MTDWFELDPDDERAVKAFMTQVAALPGAPVLRGAMPLWWKAQLLQRWDAERRAQAPLEAMERVEIVAGLVAAGGLLVWALPALVRIVVEPVRQLLG